MFVGCVAGEVALPTDVMVTNELDFRGSLGMPPAQYPEMLEMVETGKLDPEAIVSETIALEDTQDRLDAMTEYRTHGFPVIAEF